MEQNATLYDLTQTMQGVVFHAAMLVWRTTPQGQEAAQTLAAPLLQLRGGYAESPGWMLIQAAEFDPEPLSVERFRVRAVYSAPRLTAALLELLASEGWFDRQGEDYTLTTSGRAVLARIRERRVLPFAHFAPVDAAQIARLAGLLRRVIDSSLQAPKPPGTWCLAHSRNRTPDSAASPLAQIIQYGSDLNAFRDDCHMAAYRPHAIEGYCWEVFSMVCDASATTADALFDQLAYRGWTRSEYAAALDELARRGWIAFDTAGCTAAPDGLAVRAAVEQQTDAYFYAPWDCLTPVEFDELVALMTALHDGAVQRINSTAN